MESIGIESSTPATNLKNEHQNFEEQQDSSEEFQKYISDLFNKNGILNDLRAYLRKHIVDVLKTAQTGEVPSKQKLVIKHLDPAVQALNLLIAEYFVCFEFNYSLSVFVAEMPLANMSFDYASSLMQCATVDPDLRFKEKDIMSILSYLGLNCDAKNVKNLVQMYANEKQMPLLVCLFKSMSLCSLEPSREQVTSSDESLMSKRSLDSQTDPVNSVYQFLTKGRQNCCRAYHQKLERLRNKYKSKKKVFLRKNKDSLNLNVKSLLKNMNCIERSIIEEMFEQMKAVYEAELELVRAEEERKMKRSLASHALLLQHEREELEESFKAREEELEKNLRVKKKFLWGLARSLRDQHEQMSRAMRLVKEHERRLEEKESNIARQIAEAEATLRSRGENVRAQITSEMDILTRQLEGLKRERDDVQRERRELEREQRAQSSAALKDDIDSLKGSRSDYQALKDEIASLKQCIADLRFGSRPVTDHSTITDLHGVTSVIKMELETLNNEQEVRAREDDRLKKNQLVNDFKKQKNVNFQQEPHAGGNMAAGSTRGGDARPGPDKQENQSLMSSRSPLLLRPGTAPLVQPQGPFGGILSCNSNAVLSWHKGAGEDTQGGPRCRPERPPCVGVLRERHEPRRALLNQWRAARRTSPLLLRRPRPATDQSSASIERPRVSSPRLTPKTKQMEIREQTPTLVLHPNSNEEPVQSRAEAHAPPREKSPKSVLREAKRKLRTNANIKYGVPSSTARSASPAAVLREAKLRLRKLELEAEAVEESYRAFRRRRAALPGLASVDANGLRRVISKSLEKINDSQDASSDLIKNDIDRYLLQYRTKYNIGENRFYNRNTSCSNAKPIPEAFACTPINRYIKTDGNDSNYLETPLTDFRKYYQPDCQLPKHDNSKGPSPNQSTFVASSQNDQDNQHPRNSPETRDIPPGSPKSPSPIFDLPKNFPIIVNQYENEVSPGILKNTNWSLPGRFKTFSPETTMLMDKKAKMEFEILKRNIDTMYNTNKNPATEKPMKDENSNDNNNNNTHDLNNNASDNDEPSLRIEIENVRQVNEIDVPEEQENLVVVVQSSMQSVPARDSELNVEEERPLTGNMTIIISPKRSSSPVNTGEKMAAQVKIGSDVFEAIYRADPLKMESSFEGPPYRSKGDDGSASDDKDGLDYSEDFDFAADVDNYNTGNSSPISPHKSLADDNFWSS